MGTSNTTTIIIIISSSSSSSNSSSSGSRSGMCGCSSSIYIDITTCRTQGVYLVVAFFFYVNGLNEHHLLDPYGMKWVSGKIRFTHVVFFLLIVCTEKCVTLFLKTLTVKISKKKLKADWIGEWYSSFGIEYCVKFGRANAKRDGTRAETRIGLSAKRTSPFQSAGGSVQSTTRSRGVWSVDARRLATHSIRIFPLHFPSRASPCAIRSRVSYISLCLTTTLWPVQQGRPCQ